jgi:predicted transcriptional regulator
MTVEEIARELGRTVEAVRAKAADEGIALLPSTAEGDIDESPASRLVREV